MFVGTFIMFQIKPLLWYWSN